MDTAFMRKTFALIAKGLIEKEQLLQMEPTRYPYSKALQHGINMFLAASQWAGSQAAVVSISEPKPITQIFTFFSLAWLIIVFLFDDKLPSVFLPSVSKTT